MICVMLGQSTYLWVEQEKRDLSLNLASHYNIII